MQKSEFSKCQMVTSFVAMARVPCLMVTIPVAKYQTVAKVVAQNGVDIRQEAARARQRWRAIGVDDGDWRVVYDGCYSQDFCFFVDGSVDGDVEWSEGDGVVDEDGEAVSRSTTRTVPVNEVVAGDCSGLCS